MTQRRSDGIIGGPVDRVGRTTSRASRYLLLMAGALLLGATLAGCKVNPSMLYRSGYDKMLTPEAWAARKPDEAVVIVGGYPSVWQKADEPSYAFEARARYSLGWSGGYDVALVKAGTYQLETIIIGGNSFAEFGGFKGLGAASGPVIASFKVDPGQVVYVGYLDVQLGKEGVGNCWANLTAKDSSQPVDASFAKQIPYVKQAPLTGLLTVTESFIRFPCGQRELLGAHDHVWGACGSRSPVRSSRVITGSPASSITLICSSDAVRD